MNVLIPLTITEAMLATGTTIAEPDLTLGESLWVSAGTYAVGDLKVRTTTHKVYECVQAHTGRSQLPENDTAYWLEKSPTNRHAPFDIYTSTQAQALTSLTYVVRPGTFYNAVGLWGVDGANWSMTFKDAPGGSIFRTESGSLVENAGGMYEYMFPGAWRTKNKVLVKDIEPYPDAEVTVTISAATGNTVKLGVLAIGDLRPLAENRGGTTYGAIAEPVDYSYQKTEEDGTVTIKRRRSATDLRVRVELAAEDRDSALASLQEVLSVPCGWIATTAEGYDGLSTFGTGSGPLAYEAGHGI
ncbi:MAG TPA: hypothetical protein VEA40_07430, partial [Ramlibacter sp.]|nr:hypothetical protein [Ramlibacter sp.]